MVGQTYAAPVLFDVELLLTEAPRATGRGLPHDDRQPLRSGAGSQVWRVVAPTDRKRGFGSDQVMRRAAIRLAHLHVVGARLTGTSPVPRAKVAALKPAARSVYVRASPAAAVSRRCPQKPDAAYTGFAIVMIGMICHCFRGAFQYLAGAGQSAPSA